MGKYALTNLVGNTWMIESPANIGLYTFNDRTALIDSGNDKEAGKQILKLVKEKGWTLECIINTHSNADHIGGNAYLQSNTNCRIYSTRLEAAFTEDPLLEPSFLWGGYPFKELRNKFLEAAPSKVTDLINGDGPISGTELESISVKGHYFDMIGIRTPDNVVFLGDSIFSRETLEKYHIFFIYDVKEYLNTLSKIKEMKADLFVPSHGKPSKDLSELVDANKSKIESIIDTILNLCAEPKNFENILQKICHIYGIQLNSTQYLLVGSTLKSYLSYLYDAGYLECYFEDARMLWRKKS